jgi:hypothetical protein
VRRPSGDPVKAGLSWRAREVLLWRVFAVQVSIPVPKRVCDRRCLSRSGWG